MANRFPIGSAPSGEDTSADGTEKLPVSGSKFMLVSTIAAYIRTLTQTLTNKTIDLTSNTLTGTKAQFNTAVSDGDIIYGAGTVTDNAAVRFDGTGGATVQNSAMTIDDNGSPNIPTGQTYNINGSAHTHTSTVDDTAYDATTWNGDTTHAPSKNAVRDKIESMSGSNTFTTIAVSGQSDVVADSTTDTLTFAAGANITITTNAGTDTITIAASGGGGSALTNSNISPTTSNVSAAANTRYFADVSGLTASRNFVLPAGAVGDEIEINISVGDDTYTLIVIGDTGITINGGSAATEWSSLFISGESVRLIATSSTNWQVVHDGRKPCTGKMTLSGADTTSTATAETLPTWDTKVIDQGNICDTTNFRFNVRRAGNYSMGGGAYPNGTLTDQQYYSVVLKQGSTSVGGSVKRASGGANHSAEAMTEIVAAVGDAAYLYYQAQAANMGILNAHQSQFWIKEIL